jgi:L-threonylcarbamoyladenylate synthase
VESTVLDPGRKPMVLYRPGAVTAEQIDAIAGEVEVFRSNQPLAGTPQSALPSPGVGLRHYAPKARLVLVGSPFDSLRQRLSEAATCLPKERIGLMLPTELTCPILKAIAYPWGRWEAPEELARNLYAGLRFLDAQGCTVILCPVPPANGIGVAIRDRLLKAVKP